jgi:hypothetical protein
MEGMQWVKNAKCKMEGIWLVKNGRNMIGQSYRRNFRFEGSCFDEVRVVLWA